MCTWAGIRGLGLGLGLTKNSLSLLPITTAVADFDSPAVLEWVHSLSMLAGGTVFIRSCRVCSIRRMPALPCKTSHCSLYLAVAGLVHLLHQFIVYNDCCRTAWQKQAGL